MKNENNNDWDKQVVGKDEFDAFIEDVNSSYEDPSAKQKELEKVYELITTVFQNWKKQILILIGIVILAVAFFFSYKYISSILLEREESIIPTATELSLPTETLTPTPAMPTSTPSATVSPVILACVNISQLRVRSGPGTDYSLVVGLQHGECVDLISVNADGLWGVFLYEDREAWVLLDFLDFGLNFPS